MANYGGIQKEETLKSLVRDDFFSDYGYEPDIDNIDIVFTNKAARGDLFSGMDAAETRQVRNADLGEFCDVSEGNSKTPNMKSRADARFHGSSVHIAYGEAKKEVTDLYAMFTQLMLTCKKTYDKGVYLAPPWLLVFDPARIAFVPFHEMLPIFTETDFNWNQTPSNHDTPDFQKARRAVEKLIGAKIVVFNFGADDADIHEFIKTHFTDAAGGAASIKFPITKDNFAQVFIKWVKEVKPFINVSKDEWADFRKKGILDGDFYRADIMSSDGNSITEKLKIVLRNDNYKFQENIGGRLFTSDIDFTDGGAAYSRFWNRYERPPAPVYQQYIIDRRDLLSPQNIREVKGSFFTPAIWADKSKEYLADVFGDGCEGRREWQDEYYIWDCAAGTGNLLAGLSNPYNVWASDIDAGNVETMRSLVDIDENLNLLDAHIFQFDFLNDSFEKLPEELQKIINDPEKRKKLIMYINPPYAEATSARTVTKTWHNKAEVSTVHGAHAEYKKALGKAANELYSLFMMRVADKLQGACLAVFSTVKYVNSANFAKFRDNFSAQFQKGFICPSNTFDNVSGKFPIGFLIWRLSYNGYDFKFPKSVKLDVYNAAGKRAARKKGFYNKKKYINKWIKEYDVYKNDIIGFMSNPAPDFLVTNQPYITITEGTRHFNYFAFHKNNIIEGCVYLAVRLCIETSWLNNRDQFLFPNDGWKTDAEFQNDCLIFALFHGQNKISSIDGTNHWIPFTEKQVGAKEKFESNFMSEFLEKLGVGNRESGIGFQNTEKLPTADSRPPTPSSAVLAAGLELWRYYHAKIKNNKTASVNASFYDIREFFQGRKESGNMNAKSADETYNALIGTLRDAQKLLAAKIAPKVYEYGFLKE